MSVLDVWNQALSAAKARGRVDSLTEVSPEAEVCGQWYETVARSVQSAAWWPACKTTIRLALLSESTATWADGQPEPGYAYAYGLPENFLRAWYLTDYSRFALGHSPSLNRVILSANTPTAALTYARFNSDPTQWDQNLVMTTVYALATHIAGPLTGQARTMQMLAQSAQTLLDEARGVTAMQMEEGAPRTQVPWLAARGYSSEPTARFYYPHGGLYLAGAVSAS